MDNNKEKYLSESLLSEEPKKKYVLKLKDNSVTGDKIAPNAVDWDKLSQRIKDLFAAIQAAIGEPVDPETIKEMIKNVINDMIESGEEIVDIDTIAEKVAEIIQTENKNFIPFDGVMPKGTLVDVLDVQAPQDVEGNVLFYPQTGTFLYGVYEEPEEPIPGQITPPVSKYYKYWEGWTDYKDAQDTPKSKVVFVLRNGSAYYYWDGSELQRFVTETSLASTIDALDIEAVSVTGNNGVEVVETTEVVDDKTVKIKTASLADISKGTTNVVGTTYVFGNTLPTSLSSNTKYVIANNVGSGTDKITLPSGSKIVPNGGMPTVAVEGGEMSWVHSSDIGMVQDDGTHNIGIGILNCTILKNLLKSQYNLILDGEYYIHVPDGPNGFATDEDVITIDRPFSIQGGVLNLLNGFIRIVDGGSFKASETTFVKVESAGTFKGRNYRVIKVAPTNTYIDFLEFINCKFISKITVSGAISSRFIGSTTDAYTAPVDAQRKWTKAYFDYLDRPNSLYRIDVDNGDYVYFFPSNYIVDRENNIVKKVETDPETGQETETTISMSVWPDHTTEFHRGGVPVRIEDENGDTLFVLNTETRRNRVDGAWGYYVEEAIATEDEIQKSNGKKYSILMGTDPGYTTVEGLGIKKVRFVNCYMDGANVELDDMTISENCEIVNCTWNRVTQISFSISSTNTKIYANDFTHRSCPIIIQGCTFNGVEKVVTGGTYTEGVSLEVDSAIIRNCTFKNIYSDAATYDVYVSANSLIFEGNYEYNVMKVPKSSTAAQYNEFFKSKGIARKHNKYGERIIRNNWFETDGDTAWPICKSYMENKFGDDAKEVFDNFALSKKMLAFIGEDVIIGKIVIENNIFKIGGNLMPAATFSNRAGSIETLSIKNNLFSFKQYNTNAGTPIAVYRHPRPRNPISIDISGNTFTAKDPSLILFAETHDSNIVLDKVNIVNNIFNNCLFYLNNYSGGNNRGLVSVGTLNIKNNTINCTENTPSLITHKNDITLIPSDALRLYGESYQYKTDSPSSYIEIVDYQRDNKVATYEKAVEFDSCNGLNIIIPHMCRTIAFTSGGYTQGAKNYRLCKTLALFGYGITNQSYSIDIEYVYMGIQYKKRLEILHEYTNDYVEEEGVTTIKYVHPAFVFRDTNGIAYKYSNYSETSGGGSAQFKFDSIPSLNDIGLGIFVEGYGQDKVDVGNEDHDTSAHRGLIAVHFYSTYPEGTRNDIGTNIVIRCNKLVENASFRHWSEANLAGNQDNFTPLRNFVKEGSEVTAEWLASTTAGFSWYYYNHPKYESSSSNRVSAYRTTVVTPYIRPEDTGFRVHVGKQWYTCDGTQWIPDKAIVSLTQAAYDALETKDENTLYLIVDSQS